MPILPNFANHPSCTLGPWLAPRDPGMMAAHLTTTSIRLDCTDSLETCICRARTRLKLAIIWSARSAGLIDDATPEKTKKQHETIRIRNNSGPWAEKKTRREEEFPFCVNVCVSSFTSLGGNGGNLFERRTDCVIVSHLAIYPSMKAAVRAARVAF